MRSIPRRKFMALSVLLLSACSASPPSLPNIVLIVGDDLGPGEVGATGGPAPTPHIDRLAAEGVSMRQGYASAPLCTPSRAAMLSGRHPVRTSRSPSEETGIAYDVPHPLLPEVLRNAGYATGLIGKWHLGRSPELRPLARGFDEFFGFLGGGRGHFRRSADGPLLWRDGRRLHSRPRQAKQYLTTVYSREAAMFIDRHRDEPFFLFLSFGAIHIPYQVPPEYLERVPDVGPPERRVALAMMVALDDGVGGVLDTLDELGLAEDTIVVFAGDNGGAPPGSDNRPLRAGKGTLYEGGIRVPFLIRWPAKLRGGAVYDEVVTGMDLFPTLLAAAGVAPEAPVGGVDLIPFLRGERTGPPHPLAFWSHLGMTAVRVGSLKLVRRPRAPHPELYDLADDPGETRDLAGQQPERVQEIRDSLALWRAARSVREPPRPPSGA